MSIFPPKIKTIKNQTLLRFVVGCCLISTLSLLSSCKCNKGHAEILENKVEVPADEEQFQSDMREILEAYIPTLHLVKEDKKQYLGWQEVIKEIYHQQHYQPLWVNKHVLSPKGKEMLEYLATAEYLGLNKTLYGYERLRKIADSAISIQPIVNFALEKTLEVGLTRAFCQMALHIDHGMFADTLQGLNTNFWTTKEKYVQLLQLALTDSISVVIATLEPDNPMYKRYMAGLREFVSKNNISSTPIFIRNPKKDSIGAVNDARKALVYHHFLSASQKLDDSVYLAAMKRFQKENNLNGDGVLGTNTIRALERDNSKKFQLLAINADRWRSAHILTLPEKYVWVNLPSFRVKIVEADTVRMEKNVVIGKTVTKNETPILESAINQIILWPTWTVPESIVKKEMKSFEGFNVVTIDGHRKVIQPPGPKNALGCIKILFPNKYSVYMHDTPSKSLFNADFRAASHGCVRCQDALEVAAYLMSKDSIGIPYDSLKALKDSKIETRSFRLKKSVPLYFRYFTAEADFDGNLRFYADVYGRDKDMINFIFNSKQPHKLTQQEIREKQVKDSITTIRKKQTDSFVAVIKHPSTQISTSNVLNYSLKADTTSARHDSL